MSFELILKSINKQFYYKQLAMFILFVYGSGGEVTGPFETEKEAYDCGKYEYSTKFYRAYEVYPPRPKLDSYTITAEESFHLKQ